MYLQIQLKTIKQTDPIIEDEELIRITFAKGGHSVIIYHQIMEKPANEAMWKTLFYVGSLMQFGNDLFDMYKDLRDGITTLADKCPDYKELRLLFMERVERMQPFDLRTSLPCTLKKKNLRLPCILS